MKYRKKPVVIEAPVLVIDTLEGQHKAQVGDYIIKGAAGKFCPCKPDIFAATYEAADADTPIILGGKAYQEIVITGPDNEVLAVIASNNIIEYEGYQVILK